MLLTVDFLQRHASVVTKPSLHTADARAADCFFGKFAHYSQLRSRGVGCRVLWSCAKRREKKREKKKRRRRSQFRSSPPFRPHNACQSWYLYTQEQTYTAVAHVGCSFPPNRKITFPFPSPLPPLLHTKKLGLQHHHWCQGPRIRADQRRQDGRHWPSPPG